MLGNGAYIQPLGKTKSSTTGHNYNNCTVKTLTKRRSGQSFDEEEAADFEDKIEKALKALKKEKSGISDKIAEQRKRIAELRAQKRGVQKPQKKSKKLAK